MDVLYHSLSLTELKKNRGGGRKNLVKFFHIHGPEVRHTINSMVQKSPQKTGSGNSGSLIISEQRHARYESC